MARNGRVRKICITGATIIGVGALIVRAILTLDAAQTLARLLGAIGGD